MSPLSWFRSKRPARAQTKLDVDEEIRTHLELEAEERRELGVGAHEARRAAERAFGNRLIVSEDVRAVYGWPALEAVLQDVRFGVRLLLRSPAFALFAVASLALGIAAVTAIFTLFDVIVLRRLPVPEPERLVVASFGRSDGEFNYSLPYPQFAHIRDHNTTLDGVFATYPFGRVNVTYSGQPDMAQGQYVTGSYYDTLRVRPTLGRLLTPEDDLVGHAVAVVSHAYWQRRFGGEPGIVGQSITLNHVPFTIVGVEPPGFFGTEVGRGADISVPMQAWGLLNDGEPLWDEAFATWIYVMGRLKPDVTLEHALQELDALFRRASIEGARSPTQRRLARESSLRLESGATGAASDLRHNYEWWLWIVLVLLGALLLLASLNVATLLLSRSEARHHEIATRLALGAGRWRIVRQLLTESTVLAVTAGTIGLLLSWWASRVLLRLAVPGHQHLPVDLAPDVRVALFTLFVSSLTCLLFGVMPALRVTSSRRLTATREVGGRQRRLLDRALVASQVALSLMLIVTAGLFLRSLENLWTQDTGYDRDNVLMFSVDAHLVGLEDAKALKLYQRLVDRLRDIPGAQSVSLSTVRPVSDSYYLIDQATAVGDKTLPVGQGIPIAFNNILPDYFATLRIPIVAGRDFDHRDGVDAPAVAIISERMARHFTGSPVGQRIRLSDSRTREVVGVAKDMRYASVKDAPREVVYLPVFQEESLSFTPSFEIRHAGPAANLLAPVREAVTRTDAGLTPFNVKTLEVQTQESLSRERLLAMLTSFVGGFALLLASIGIYGLTSSTVTQRTPELGVRMALGATPAAVQRLIVRHCTAMVLVGALLGFAGCLVLGRLVQSQLYGLEPYDAPTFTWAAGLLLLVAFGAAYLPALRASRIDPLQALRHD